MTYKRLPSDLPKQLRAAGFKVVVVPGWRLRGRPASTGEFAPVGVLNHHTATSRKSSVAAVLALLVRGRSDLPGPLCQLGLGRDGTVFVVASGRANHAGTAKASGSVAAGDGNKLYIGIEAFNDGVGEPWNDLQYDTYVKLNAFLNKKVTGNSYKTDRGHKETSVTGKIDPRFDMDVFRNKVRDRMDGPEPAPVQKPHWTTPVIKEARRRRADALKKGQAQRAQKLQALIAAGRLVRRAKTNDDHSE
jgi:hypothetical protein